MSVKHVQFNLKDCKSTQYYRLNTLIVLKVQMKWFLVAFIFQGLSNHLAMNRLAKNDKGLCWNYFGLKKHFYFTCITLCKVLPWALMISGTSPLPTTKGIINIDPFIADEGTHMDSYWSCRKDISKFTDTCICVCMCECHTG